MHPTLLLSSLLLLSPLSSALTIPADPLTKREDPLICFSGPFGTIKDCDCKCDHTDDSKPVWKAEEDTNTKQFVCFLDSGPSPTLPSFYGPVGYQCGNAKIEAQKTPPGGVTPAGFTGL